MSDPKNKWTRPGAPPAPMFFGEKERNLVKQVKALMHFPPNDTNDKNDS